MPPLLAAKIRAFGEPAVEPLIAVLTDSTLRDPSGPADGFGSVHAAQLLGQLDPERAVEPLLDVLATTAGSPPGGYPPGAPTDPDVRD
jgi:HEAT repeat protein